MSKVSMYVPFQSFMYISSYQLDEMLIYYLGWGEQPMSMSFRVVLLFVLIVCIAAICQLMCSLA
jgi:hypothetical protein